MEGKIINKSSEKIIKGIEKVVDTVKVTLGPSGKAVAIDTGIASDIPDIQRDGATILKSISFKDREENMGAQLVRKASSQCESESGDSTTTCAILINEFCKKGQKYIKTGSNVNEVKSGMLKAGKYVSDYIKSKSISVAGDLEKIRKVATISGNNDPTIGDLIVESLEKVGIDGIIRADLSSGLDTTIDVTTGMKLNKGWNSPQYITNASDGVCEMENPYIAVIGEKISSVPQVYPVIEAAMKVNRPLLIICDDIDQIVDSTLILNTLQGIIRACVIKGIDFGDARKNTMADIAISCGGEFICPDNGKDLNNFSEEFLGSAKKVIVSRDSTIIYEGAGDKDVIKARVDILKKRLEDPKVSDYDKTKFENRIANLTGGISTIFCGGATEAEKLNIKSTVTDAILASKSAIEEGYVPGSGIIYYRASLDVKKDKTFWKSLEGDEHVGADIIFSSLPIIMKTVADNAGWSGDVVLEAVKNYKKETMGFNAKTRTYCDLLENGILDSAKSIRIALNNAISTASMVLLIDSVVVDEEDDNESNQ